MTWTTTARAGQWVRRKRRRTRWHLVETRFANGVVTACTRWMTEFTIDRGHLEVSDGPPVAEAPIPSRGFCRTCSLSRETP